MSAVIWFGIVAVWAFVLIPTWVRRSDIHWRRSGETSGTRDKIGRAARVISRSGSGAAAGARGAVPGMRRPSSAPRRTVAATSSSSTVHGRATAVLDEPPTEQFSAVTEEPRQADRFPETDTQTDSETPTRTATSAQAADAAATEAPMTTARTSRPAPRRGATRATQSTPPPHVQRARRLVWIGATALATLLLAFIFRGWWVALNLLADVALVAYLRHLRGIALQQQASRRNRGQAGRSSAGRASEVRERVAAPRAPRRAPAPRHRAEQAPARTAPAPPAAAPSVAPQERPVEAPVEVIDLTDDALHDDCPTTELISARAV